MDSFSSQEEEDLISLVGAYPCLYDNSNATYKNVIFRENVWREIGAQLNKNPDACKSRWRNIKDTYARQKKKVLSGIGSASSKNPRHKFQTYSRLLGFLDNVKSEREITNVDINSQLELYMQSEENNLEGQDGSPTGKERKKRTKPIKKSLDNSTMFPYLQKRDDPRQQAMLNAASGLKESEDEVGSFATHMKNVLRKLTPLLRIRAKQELFEVLTKYEVMAVDPLYLPNSCCNTAVTQAAAAAAVGVGVGVGVGSPVRQTLMRDVDPHLHHHGPS